MKKYSFKKGLLKALFSIIIVGVPVIVQILPSYVANLTVSGILIMLVNYIKVVSGE
jgi:hypothetical protein